MAESQAPNSNGGGKEEKDIIRVSSTLTGVGQCAQVCMPRVGEVRSAGHDHALSSSSKQVVESLGLVLEALPMNRRSLEAEIGVALFYARWKYVTEHRLLSRPPRDPDVPWKLLLAVLQSPKGR